MIKSKIVKQKKKYIIRTELPEVEFTTSIGCHINCKLCPQELFIKRYKQISDINILTFENFKKLIDKIPKNIVILFSGMTEPWLNKDCSKMVLYAYNTGHTNIKIFTTAVGMTPEDIDKIKHIPFRQFVLHLPDVFGITEIKDTKIIFNAWVTLKNRNMPPIAKINATIIPINLFIITTALPIPRLVFSFFKK